jgi:hypothetical protein
LPNGVTNGFPRWLEIRNNFVEARSNSWDNFAHVACLAGAHDRDHRQVSVPTTHGSDKRSKRQAVAVTQLAYEASHTRAGNRLVHASACFANDNSCAPGNCSQYAFAQLRIVDKRCQDQHPQSSATGTANMMEAVASAVQAPVC